MGNSKNQELDRLKRMAKGNKKYGAIGKVYYRQISIRITRQLIRTNITPNQITGISFILGIVSGFLFALGDYIYLVLGAVFLQFSLILDCVDGEIARIKSLKSKTGEFLDGILDQVKQTAIFFGIGYGIYARTHYVWVWILILFTLICYHLIVIIALRKKILDMKYPPRKNAKKVRNMSKPFINQELSLRPGFLSETIITIGALLNQLLIALLVISIAVYINTIRNFLINFKQIKRDDYYMKKAPTQK